MEQNSKGEPVQLAPWVKKVALIAAAGERICQQTQSVPSVTFSLFNYLFQIMANSWNHSWSRFLNGCQSSVPSTDQHITWKFQENMANSTTNPFLQKQQGVHMKNKTRENTTKINPDLKPTTFEIKVVINRQTVGDRQRVWKPSTQTQPCKYPCWF